MGKLSLSISIKEGSFQPKPYFGIDLNTCPYIGVGYP
jgi:hypothetical protein